MRGEQQSPPHPITPHPVTPRPSAITSHLSLPQGANTGVEPLRADTLHGLGGGALARAVERWRRALLHDDARPAGANDWTTAGSTGGGSATGATTHGAATSASVDPDALMTLARRLDDSGCSYGRVSAARLDGVIRASDRMETKLNAVLMAVTGTFLSTLAGLLLYYVRGGGQ